MHGAHGAARFDGWCGGKEICCVVLRWSCAAKLDLRVPSTFSFSAQRAPKQMLPPLHPLEVLRCRGASRLLGLVRKRCITGQVAPTPWLAGDGSVHHIYCAPLAACPLELGSCVHGLLGCDASYRFCNLLRDIRPVPCFPTTATPCFWTPLFLARSTHQVARHWIRPPRRLMLCWLIVPDVDPSVTLP